MVARIFLQEESYPLDQYNGTDGTQHVGFDKVDLAAGNGESQVLASEGGWWARWRRSDRAVEGYDSAVYGNVAEGA